MTKKIATTIVIALVVMLAFSLIAPVFAVDPHSITINASGEAQDKVSDVAGNIIGIIQIVGTAIAIIMLIYLGIKYVIAAPDEKANIKKSALIYVVAAVFIFAAVNILAIIQDFSNDIFQ